MCKFANIHNHTDKGSFDAVTSASQFVNVIKKLGQNHVVQTDHGSLKGMIELSRLARKEGLRYIPGVEVYTTLDSVPQRGLDLLGKKYYHMLLIAKNQKGFENLMKLLKKSYQDDGHFYSNPRVSLDEISELSEGLIATTGCSASPLSTIAILETKGVKDCFSDKKLETLKHLHAIGKSCDDHYLSLTEEEKLAFSQIEIPKGIYTYEKILDKLLNIFGDNLYAEVQDCGFEDQIIVNQYVDHYAKKYGIPIIATSDSHYPEADQKYIRELMMRIRMSKLDVDDKNEFFSSESLQLYLKSGEELASVFGEEACLNTIDLVNRCEDISFEHGTLFPVPLNRAKSNKEIFREKIEEGLIKKIGNSPDKVYLDRIEEEFEVISSLGFIDYFLVLIEILDRARKEGYLIGPARGSVSGSLIAYLTNITQIDPVYYKLYFSRFLNKDRISVPDIDIDIESNKRSRFISMVSEMHGSDKVCQIMTYSKMKPKSIARDLGRIYKVPELGNEVAKLIPPPLHGKECSVAEALEAVPELSKDEYKIIVDRMLDLESLTKTDSIHAGGVIISPVELTKLIPVEYKRSKEADVAQLSMEEIENVGLIKYDFLGLRNLDVISELLKTIDIQDIYADIPVDDQKTFDELSNSKDFGGFFQFEGSLGIGELLRQIQPKSIEDIAIATALYRPGPLNQNMDKDYLERRSSRWKPESKLDECIPETFGVIIYQEQILKICIQLAGFKESEADTVRKILGKKKKEEVDKWKKPFIEGCRKVSGLTEPEALAIWGSIEAGSDYLFSLNHAVAYAYLTYITAYLRTHYKEQFICSLLNQSESDRYKFLGGLSSGKNLGIEIRPPRLSLLNEECIVESENVIRLGTKICKSVKGMGEYAVKAARKNPQSLFEFIGYVNRSKLNVRVCKAMVSAGVFDEFSFVADSKLNRTALRKLTEDYYSWFKLNETKYEQLLKWEDRRQRREAQENLKKAGLDYGPRLVAVGKKPELPDIPNIEDYLDIQNNPFENSLYEYEILGCTSGHNPVEFMHRDPQFKTIADIKTYLTENYDDVNEVKMKAKLIGIIAKSKESLTSNKDAMAALLVEDETDSAQMTVFPFALKKIKAKGLPLDDLSIFVFDVLAKISYSTYSESVTISFIVNDVSPAEIDKRKLIKLQDSSNVSLNLNTIDDLKNFIKQNPLFRGEIIYKNLKGIKIS